MQNHYITTAQAVPRRSCMGKHIQTAQPYRGREILPLSVSIPLHPVFFTLLLVTQELQPLSRETDGAVIDKNEPSGRVIGGRCVVVLFEISTVCAEIIITLFQRCWVITDVGYSISGIGFSYLKCSDFFCHFELPIVMQEYRPIIIFLLMGDGEKLHPSSSSTSNRTTIYHYLSVNNCTTLYSRGPHAIFGTGTLMIKCFLLLFWLGDMLLIILIYKYRQHK